MKINIRPHQSLDTLSQLIMLASIMSIIQLSVNDENIISAYSALFSHPYAHNSNLTTYNDIGDQLTSSYTTVSPTNFEKTISDFYAKLLASQEPLGEEFEKVLYDNFWDLIV